MIRSVFPPMNKLRIGHVGWLTVDEGPDHTTTAWCDVDQQRLLALERAHPGIRMFTDFRSMAEFEALDLVVIATPNWLHFEMACEFLKAGKHVFLEKPMAMNSGEMQELLEAAKRSGRNLAIDFEMRISPFACRIQEILASGEVGELRRLEFIHHRGGWMEEGNGIWRTRKDKCGGLFLMEIIHAIDVFRLFGGEITSVRAVCGPNVFTHYEFPDNACLHLGFASGVQGVILSSHTLSAQDASVEELPQRGHDMNMILTCSQGSIAVNFLRGHILINRYERYPEGTSGMRAVFGREEDHSALGGSFFHDIDRMRRDFISRCARGADPIQSPEDALKTHLVCLAADESFRLGSQTICL